MGKKLNISKFAPKVVYEKVEKDDKRFVHCRVLIVCEGEKTEPNYFRSFELMKNHSDLVFELAFDGGGINTMAVVNKAVELKEEAEQRGKPYDAVWAVFDKDNFPDQDFDNAINKAEQNGIGCAWSNEAFELWFVYHFDNRTTHMSREEYQSVIVNRIKMCDKSYTKYRKNDPLMRQRLLECGGSEELAIRYAKAQCQVFQDKCFHKHNPATTVYKLVELLTGKDETFNKLIRRKVNAK